MVGWIPSGRGTENVSAKRRQTHYIRPCLYGEFNKEIFAVKTHEDRSTENYAF